MNLQDIAPELGKLLAFVGATGRAAGEHSAGNPEAELARFETAVDLHWLSEPLLDFDQFGSAISNNNAAQLAAACECHIKAFKALAEPTRHPHQPAATFKRSRRHFEGKDLVIGEMVEVLECLRGKALAQARIQRERRSLLAGPLRRTG